MKSRAHLKFTTDAECVLSIVIRFPIDLISSKTTMMAMCKKSMPPKPKA